METAVAVESLPELEARIERGLQTFVEVGTALLEIRDRRLYREGGHQTFEDYCQTRWGFSKTHANRLVGAASVVGTLTPIGVTPPTNEAQARELALLVRQSPERAADVWRGLRDLAERLGDDEAAQRAREALAALAA